MISPPLVPGPEPRLTDDDKRVIVIVQKIVTMPSGREHTSVPCDDLRTLARYITAMLERLAALEAERARLRPEHVAALGRFVEYGATRGPHDNGLITPHEVNLAIEARNILREFAAAPPPSQTPP